MRGYLDPSEKLTTRYPIPGIQLAMSVNIYKKAHEPVPTLNAFIRSTLLRGEVSSICEGRSAIDEQTVMGSDSYCDVCIAVWLIRGWLGGSWWVLPQSA